MTRVPRDGAGRSGAAAVHGVERERMIAPAVLRANVSVIGHLAARGQVVAMACHHPHASPCDPGGTQQVQRHADPVRSQVQRQPRAAAANPSVLLCTGCRHADSRDPSARRPPLDGRQAAASSPRDRGVEQRAWCSAARSTAAAPSPTRAPAGPAHPRSRCAAFAPKGAASRRDRTGRAVRCRTHPRETGGWRCAAACRPAAARTRRPRPDSGHDGLQQRPAYRPARGPSREVSCDARRSLCHA